MNEKKKSLKVIIILSIIAIIGLIIVKIYNPEEENFFIPCIFYKVTGLKCSGCGMTRALHYLLNGNIKKAIWYNLMIIPGGIVFLYGFYRYLKYILNNEKIVNKPLEIILIIYLIALIVFMVVRNITTAFY